MKPYSIDGEPRGVLVYGPMGSGKTTLTAAIMNTYPPWVRVVAVQDVDEFKVLPIRTFNVLNTRASTGLGAKPITKAELIADAMRTGAQFVFVNEVLNLAMPGPGLGPSRVATVGLRTFMLVASRSLLTGSRGLGLGGLVTWLGSSLLP